MKRRCGEDYPVATNINAREFGLRDGITLEEAKGFAPYLEAAGADILQVRVSSYGPYLEMLFPETLLYPETPKNLDLGELDVSRGGRGMYLNIAAAVKQTVSIPVFCAGRLDPELGDQALREGKIDFVGMTRRLIADHELPNKVAAGRMEDIRPCCGCCYCVETRKDDGPQKCRVNPESGQRAGIRDHAGRQEEEGPGCRRRTGRHGGGQSGCSAGPRRHSSMRKALNWAACSRSPRWSRTTSGKASWISSATTRHNSPSWV